MSFLIASEDILIASEDIAASRLSLNPVISAPIWHTGSRTSITGDGVTILVTKLDRLGRSTRELLDLIDRIGKAGVLFRSLVDPLWDTSNPQGRLLSTLLAAIAEFERELIRERTGEGRRLATIKRRAAGETLASIARSYAVDLSMISRL